MKLKDQDKFHGFAVTHPSLAKGREENQDAVIIVENHALKFKKGSLYGVADGIGSEPAGTVASYLSLKTLSEYYYQSDESDILTSLAHAVKEANREIYLKAQQDPLCKGMGATLSTAVVKDDYVYIAHVGDSRVYFFNQALGLKQLTRDDLDKEGKLVESIGAGYYVKVQTRRIKFTQNDLLLLCTDGLSRSLTAKQMESVLRSHLSLDKKCLTLVENAVIRHRSQDNVSALIIGKRELMAKKIKPQKIGDFNSVVSGNIISYQQSTVEQKKATNIASPSSFNKLKIAAGFFIVAILFYVVGVFSGLIIGGKSNFQKESSPEIVALKDSVKSETESIIESQVGTQGGVELEGEQLASKQKGESENNTKTKQEEAGFTTSLEVPKDESISSDDNQTEKKKGEKREREESPNTITISISACDSISREKITDFQVVIGDTSLSSDTGFIAVPLPEESLSTVIVKARGYESKSDTILPIKESLRELYLAPEYFVLVQIILQKKLQKNTSKYVDADSEQVEVVWEQGDKKLDFVDECDGFYSQNVKKGRYLKIKMKNFFRYIFGNKSIRIRPKKNQTHLEIINQMSFKEIFQVFKDSADFQLDRLKEWNQPAFDSVYAWYPEHIRIAYLEPSSGQEPTTEMLIKALDGLGKLEGKYYRNAKKSKQDAIDHARRTWKATTEKYLLLKKVLPRKYRTEFDNLAKVWNKI